MERYSLFTGRKIQYRQDLFLSNLINKFNTDPIKIPVNCLVHINKGIIMFLWYGWLTNNINFFYHSLEAARQGSGYYHRWMSVLFSYRLLTPSYSKKRVSFMKALISFMKAVPS